MKVDYTPSAVLRRLRAVDELRDLCRTLAASRPMERPHALTSADVRTVVKEAQENYNTRS